MVLSNKKLKQKLREAKVEQLAASELSQNNSTKNKDLKIPENPTAEAQKSIQSLLEKVTQKPRLSKGEKRREKVQSLPEKIPTLGGSDGGEVEKEGDEGGVNGSKKEKKKKRKRGESEGGESEEVKEVKTANKPKNKKKKKKKVKKKKKAVENGEGVEIEGGGNVLETSKAIDSKENLEICPKVYVGGIPYYSTEDDIRSYFESCGTITEIDCMMFPESGKFRGIAIINFKTEAAAKRALALDGSDMGGLYLKIQPYKSVRVNKTSSFAPAVVEGYNRIYAGNLSWDISEDDLKKLFSGCTITSIRFGEDKETGEFKGYAHVDFADSLSLNMALKLDQKIVCGRPIKISCAVPKKGAVNNSQSVQQNTQVDSTEVRGAVSNLQSVQQNSQVDSTEVKGTVNNIQSLQQNSQVDSTEVTVVSSKIRRRTCYECGERGHLSSSCPKKQETDQADPVAS